MTERGHRLPVHQYGALHAEGTGHDPDPGSAYASRTARQREGSGQRRVADPPARSITPRRNVEAFLLAFDSNLAPIVGQQVTLTRQNAAAVGPRLDLLIARADADECDLVAKNRWGGFLYVGEGKFRFSHRGIPEIPDPVLRATTHLPQGEITYTCVPPGSGRRIGLDRDEDGLLDGEDHDTRRGSTTR